MNLNKKRGHKMCPLFLFKSGKIFLQIDNTPPFY